MAPMETSAAPQPATLSTPERYDGLRSDEPIGPDRLIPGWGTDLCMLAARVSARAGCGKSARPVRRGERSDVRFLSYSTATRGEQRIVPDRKFLDTCRLDFARQ